MLVYQTKFGQRLSSKDRRMTKVKVTAMKSTIEGIVPRYNLAVQATRRIYERSVLDNTYNKIPIFYSSPDQIEETDTTESFEIDSEKTDSVDFMTFASITI